MINTNVYGKAEHLLCTNKSIADMFSTAHGYAEWQNSFPTILNHDIEVISHLASAQTDSDDKHGDASNSVILQKAKDKLVREHFYKVRCLCVW